MAVNQSMVIVRGGGDLATGAAVRLFRTGFDVLVTEIAAPLAVRRRVALAEAVYQGRIQIEEVIGVRVDDAISVNRAFRDRQIAVLIDPQAGCLNDLRPEVLIDGRMLKAPPQSFIGQAELTIGLGPGFEAGVHCHAVIETNRGHSLGRVCWEGLAAADTGVPERVGGYLTERVLRAPVAGHVQARVDIGIVVDFGTILAEVEGQSVKAPFRGALRGIIHESVRVEQGEKIGDLDPRADPALCWQISDKSLAVGGGVLEAVFSKPGLGLKRFS